MDATVYIAITMGLLVLLGLYWYLLGRLVIHWFVDCDQSSLAERRLLTMAAGMAVYMILCAALGAVGQFNLVTIVTMFCVALAANFAMMLIGRAPGEPLIPLREGATGLFEYCCRNAHAILAVLLLSASFLFTAIAGNGAWDSYAYHLPQARLIAESGRLAVNEHLQVPLHPHYYHLLYASALLLWDDRLANVIHTVSAIFSVLGVFWLGRIWFGRLAAFLACVLYAALSLGIHSGPGVITTAYVDFGTAIFTPFAYHCLARALADANGRMLCLAALLMGVSLGIKTQAWVGAPAFALLAFLAVPRIRRARPIVIAALLASLVGGFWYLRNFLVSGDPIHPLGGNWFGHWGWNAADLEMLRQWIEDHSGLSPLQIGLIAPALATPFFMRRRDGLAAGTTLIVYAGLTTWAITSFHDRFLLSIAPILMLSSAWVVATTCRWVWNRIEPATSTARGMPVLSAFLKWAAAMLCVLWAFQSLGGLARTNSERCGEVVCPTTPRGAAPHRVIQTFGHEDWLKVYQLNLVWAHWYIGRDVVGGFQGPSRYKDLVAQGGDGEAIKSYLNSFGRNALLANVWSSNHALPITKSFLEHFVPCGRQGHVALYVMREALAERSGPNWPPPVCEMERT